MTLEEWKTEYVTKEKIESMVRKYITEEEAVEILNQTAEYLGISLNDGTDIQALLDEITTLRSELLTVNQTLADSVKK